MGGSRSAFSQKLWSNNSEYDEAWDAFFRHLFTIIGETATITDLPPMGEFEDLPHVSAFLQMTSFWELPASNVWAWARDFDRDAVREVVAGALKCSGVPEELIARDAIRFIAALPLQKGNGTRKISAFGHLPTVDVWEIDYAMADVLALDLGKLQAALYHRCEWTIQITTNLLIRKADNETRRSIAERVLKDGRGITLWAIGAIVSTLNAPSRVNLLTRRLRQPLVDGCEYLLATIDSDLTNGDEAYQLLGHCLMSGTAPVAIAAAKAASRLADSADHRLMPVLTSAYEFWLEHEEPYPKNGGVIPNSPRQLLLQAMQKIEPVSDEKLFLLIADERSDVRETAEKWFINRLAVSAAVRADFLDRIDTGGLSSKSLASALREKVPFSGAQLTRIRRWLSAPNAEMRYAAMGVLVEAYLPAEDITDHAAVLISDVELDIRDRAHRIQDKLSKSAA